MIASSWLNHSMQGPAVPVLRAGGGYLRNSPVSSFVLLFLPQVIHVSLPYPTFRSTIHRPWIHPDCLYLNLLLFLFTSFRLSTPVGIWLVHLVFAVSLQCTSFRPEYHTETSSQSNATVTTCHPPLPDSGEQTLLEIASYRIRQQMTSKHYDMFRLTLPSALHPCYSNQSPSISQPVPSPAEHA